VTFTLLNPVFGWLAARNLTWQMVLVGLDFFDLESPCCMNWLRISELIASMCRKKRLYAEQLEQRRSACETANDWDREYNLRLKTEIKADRKRIRQLERELTRKEKALAEAAALQVLRKKAEAIW
jgi:hypothetical protein